MKSNHEQEAKHSREDQHTQTSQPIGLFRSVVGRGWRGGCSHLDIQPPSHLAPNHLAT